MAGLHRTPIGDVMARTVGDVEVLGVGVREFTVEIWDTVLYCISIVVVMLFIDPFVTLLALVPVPVALLVAHLVGRWITRRTTLARQVNALLTASIQSGAAAWARLEPLLALPVPVAGEPPLASFQPSRLVGLDARLPGSTRAACGPASVAVRDVTFTYPDATTPALTGVTLDVPAG